MTNPNTRRPPGTAASLDEMQQLHALLFDALIDYCRTTPPGKRRASMLEVVQKFLRDFKVGIDIMALTDRKHGYQSLRELYDM